MSATDIATPTLSLEALLRPERIALVGASDKNLFSRRAFAQHNRVTGAKPITLVNPRSSHVHGVDTVGSCRDIEGGIDCAFLLTPQNVTRLALEDAAAGGARAAAVLSQGWAEAGPEGRREQEYLVALAADLGITLLGPNHLGFANLWDGIALCALGLDMPVEPGNFALVSQSGTTCGSTKHLRASDRLGEDPDGFGVVVFDEVLQHIGDGDHRLVASGDDIAKSGIVTGGVANQ